MVALTVPEFTCELDLNAGVSFECVCRRFLDDANRAVVWFIRFRALTGWCEREDTAAWLRSEPARAQHASELAASFELNDDWQFDPVRFRSAVESVGRGNWNGVGETLPGLDSHGMARSQRADRDDEKSRFRGGGP